MPSGLHFLVHARISKWLLHTVHGLGNDAAGSALAVSFFSHTSEIVKFECPQSRGFLVAYVTVES
jgi:hypothetical protein